MDREKLAQAINLGFIRVSKASNGLMQYSLTKAGAIQWLREKTFGVKK